MVSRIFHTFLVGLILVNPVFCGVLRLQEDVAACQGGACRVLCMEERGSACRECDSCNRPSAEHQAPAKSPSECPGGSSCQCFSAGAIVQKPASVEADQGELAVGRADILSNLVQSGLGPALACPDARLAPGKANLGRKVRCTHSSFLC